MVQAVIMAGGEGSRLRPLTCDRPKPMVPLLNRPVMEFTVELLKKHGIPDIGVTLQYLPRQISDYFGDGSPWGVTMRYFIEDSPLGTAGSVKNTGNFLRETFIVVSGDALTDFNLTEALDFHRANGALATLVLTRVEIPLEYGVVITEKNGAIRQFLEKPGWGEVFSDTVNTGIYILEPEVLDYIPPGAKFDFSKDLFPRLLEDGKPIFGVTLTGYWCDIGSLKQYQEAHYAALEGRVVLNLGQPKEERVFIGENCQIDPLAVIKGPAWIGSGCHIGREARIGPYAVLGQGCRIDDFASLKKAILWNGTFVGRRAEIRGAVLCERVTVHPRAMVHEGAVIGDGSTLEEEVRIRPDTFIWPGKQVESGVVQDSHLIWGTKSCRSIFGTDGAAGSVNINLTPECAAKLGAVYGSVLGAESAVLVTSENDQSARMIKMALQAGLLSTGIKVIDGGILVGPVHRRAIGTLGTKGGVHVKVSSADPERLHINFFSGTGAPISRDMERKIENQFERNDFQRRPHGSVGQLDYMPGLIESYLYRLLESVNTDGIRGRRFRIAAGFLGEDGRHLVSQALAAMGCDVALYELTGEAGAFSSDLASAAERMAGRELQADLGVVFDNNAENLILIDPRGRVLHNDRYLALMALVTLETSRPPVVAVPVHGTSVVEKMAEARQGRVVRTKTAPVKFLNEVLKTDIREAQGPLGQSAWTFDALAALTRILAYLAESNQNFSQLVSKIPDIYTASKETDCPWGAKGKVIRKIIEENKEGQVELLDGVKVYHDGGWALVLPDADKPRYRVYSEGFSYEFAENLADFYIDKINQLRNE